MKQFFFLVAVISIISTNIYSQTTPVDTSWKKGGFIGLNFTQVNLSQWAPGGENSMALASNVNLYANYATKDRIEWANSLDLTYAMIKSGSEKLRKSDDRIELNSKFGKKLTDKWLLSFLLNFKSQFAPGYNYPNDSILISEFFSPAYLTLAVGFTYKPVDYFEIFISPATAKFTFVNNKTLSNFGAYGVDSGKTMRTEVGAYLNIKFEKEVLKNVTLLSRLELFNNYDGDYNGKQIDVNWITTINMKINDYLNASFNTNVVYDSDIIQRTQFKEMLGVGLGYKFPRAAK
jgi:hypothetical protein